jgi:hypothetical protein
MQDISSLKTRSYITMTKHKRKEVWFDIRDDLSPTAIAELFLTDPRSPSDQGWLSPPGPLPRRTFEI